MSAPYNQQADGKAWQVIDRTTCSINSNRWVTSPDFPELFTQLQFDCLQKLTNGITLPDHHLSAVPCAIPVTVGDLQRLILHYLSASQDTRQWASRGVHHKQDSLMHAMHVSINVPGQRAIEAADSWNGCWCVAQCTPVAVIRIPASAAPAGAAPVAHVLCLAERLYEWKDPCQCQKPLQL